MWFGHWGWGLLLFGGLFKLAILIIIIWLIWRVTSDRHLRHGEGSSYQHVNPTEESALDILKRRYAKGEISKDDYERMRNDLKD